LHVLHEFLAANRTQLIERCRLKASSRCAESEGDSVYAHGIPELLDQIIKTLRIDMIRGAKRTSNGSAAPPAGLLEAMFGLSATARRRGQQLQRRGYAIDLLVHDYGDFFQAVTDLAIELHSQIDAEEFRTLHRCLDQAMADSVTAFCYQWDHGRRTHDTEVFREQLGVLVHEARNLVATANYAMLSMTTGKALIRGPADQILTRCLTGLRNLIERSVAAVRSAGQLPMHKQLMNLSDFVADLQLAARLEAQACDCILTVAPVDPHLAVDADPDMLLSAVNNLLKNAFKFTAPGSEVTLSVYAVSDRVRIDVEDRCGGWTCGDVEEMFKPFNQCGDNKSGLGLGLSICRRCVEANHGAVSARDVPGEGCIFTIDLPRIYTPKHSAASNGFIAESTQIQSPGF
jgi:signal transduction histidine kinase